MRKLTDVLGMERHIVQTRKQFDEMINELGEASIISFDTETTGLDYLTCDLVGASFSNGKKGWYVPVGHITEEEQIPKFVFIDNIKKIMENPKIAKIAHNLKFDYQIMKQVCGVGIEGQWFDTMIAHWLLNENGRHGLKVLSEKYLGYKQTEFTEVVPKGQSFKDTSIEVGGEYAVDDAIVTFRLMEYFAPMLAKQDLENPFFKIEMPLVKVLAEMELKGVPIDVDYLRAKGEWITETVAEINQEFWDFLGYPINLNSTKQLGEALFGKLKYPVQRVTPTGNPSTDRDTLLALERKGYPIAGRINRYKMLKKIQGTYVDGLIDKVRVDGRVHGSFNHIGTVTGRLSSSNPNLQNIPARDEETQIKRAFIVPEGYKMINADYSQIELRVMAHFSQDKAMVEAYNQGQDLHCRTASQLSNIEYATFLKAIDNDKQGKELTDMDNKCLRLRGLAKGVNFGIIYGRGSRSLAEGEGITEKEAIKYIDDYFKSFSGVKAFIDHTHKTAKKYGYVRSLTGRKRRLPKIYSERFGEVKSAERQSVNSKIQGSAGDIMKLAMIDLEYNVLPKFNADLLIQVHDEVIIHCPEEHAEECKEAVRESMINAVQLRVPLDVDIRISDNWAEGH